MVSIILYLVIGCFSFLEWRLQSVSLFVKIQMLWILLGWIFKELLFDSLFTDFVDTLKLIICYISSGATNIAEVSSGFHQADWSNTLVIVYCYLISFLFCFICLLFYLFLTVAGKCRKSFLNIGKISFRYGKMFSEFGKISFEYGKMFSEMEKCISIMGKCSPTWKNLSWMWKNLSRITRKSFPNVEKSLSSFTGKSFTGNTKMADHNRYRLIIYSRDTN